LFRNTKKEEDLNKKYMYVYIEVVIGREREKITFVGQHERKITEEKIRNIFCCSIWKNLVQKNG
jgi:hypothetical protein